MRRRLTGFLRDKGGIALMEFALVFPFIMLMLLGGLEVSRAILITQRVEKAGYVIADITSQFVPATASHASAEISVTQLSTNVMPQLNRIMGTYADNAKQAVIITSIFKEAGIKKIKWQVAGGGSLTSGVTSAADGLSPAAIGVGVKDRATSFPAEVEANLAAMPNGENLIMAEIFYHYDPVWTRVIAATPTSFVSGASVATIASPTLLVKRMYFRPRNGDMVCLPPTFIYPDCT